MVAALLQPSPTVAALPAADAVSVPARPKARLRQAPPPPAPGTERGGEPALDSGPSETQDSVLPDPPNQNTALEAASAPQDIAQPAPTALAPAATTANQPASLTDAAPGADGTLARPAQDRPRHFNINLPPSADLQLDIIRTEPGREHPTRGAGQISWRLGDGTYSIAIEAGLDLLITRLNLLTITSEGRIDHAGIAPRKVLERRRGRSETATHFNREQGTISFSASTNSLPLVDGTQDKATVPMQLAGIGRADPRQLEQQMEILVAEERAASLFKFVSLGMEEIESKMGKLKAWHLFRPPLPGSYSSRLDIWLAPDLNWYPVQLRNTEANGAVTTQTVSAIIPRPGDK